MARRLHRWLRSRSLRSRPHNQRLELTLASALARLRCAQLSRRANQSTRSATHMQCCSHGVARNALKKRASAVTKGQPALMANAR